MPKLIRQVENIITDCETGEVKLVEQHNVIELPTEPPWVKFYINDISKLHGLSTGCSGLLFELIHRMSWDGVITVIASTKKRIAQSLGVKPQSVDNNLQKLLKANILTRAGRSEYMANPDYFAHGKWTQIAKKRNKYIEMTIKYNSESGRTIKAKMK